MRVPVPPHPSLSDPELSLQIDTTVTPPRDIYPWLTGLVNPRPIAWVLTRSATGVLNLAPFSFFNVFGSNPPVLVFSPTLRRDGSRKDTLVNIEATGECVVHVATSELRELVNLSSAEVPPDQSEVELTGQRTVPSVKVSVPRLVEPPAAFECRLRQIVPVGDGPIAARLVICEILTIHVSDAVLAEDGRPDPHKLRTVARMGGDWWCHASDLFQLPRPHEPK